MTAKKRGQSPQRAPTVAATTTAAAVVARGGGTGRGKSDIGSYYAGTSITLLLLCVVYGASAAHRYIAIPVDGIDVIELSPVAPPSRITRQTDAYVPVAVPNIPQEEFKSPRAERSTAHILDYVDFGAHTGSNGAFSWYADYPAHH
ncbi:hypothetical protein ANTRET_LOCUS8482 [Anthophora retusa]